MNWTKPYIFGVTSSIVILIKQKTFRPVLAYIENNPETEVCFVISGLDRKAAVNLISALFYELILSTY